MAQEYCLLFSPDNLKPHHTFDNFFFFLLYHRWYMKAHQINPKNGRPYNQLAILAMYTVSILKNCYFLRIKILIEFHKQRPIDIQLFDCKSHLNSIIKNVGCFLSLFHIISCLTHPLCGSEKFPRVQIENLLCPFIGN